MSDAETDALRQGQSFRDLALSGPGNTLTISQLIPVSPSVVQDRPLIASSPYLGLQRFEEQHTHLFFGRDAQVAELFDAVVARPFALVLGASGSGKSSLVRAGLIPLLRRRIPKLRVFSLVPDRDPFDSLRAMLLHGGCRHQAADQALSREPETLLQLCRNPRLRRADEPWLLFIDQFEELFTRAAPATSAAFLNALVRLCDEGVPEVRVVATLRADFLHRFDPFPKLLRCIKPSWQPITTPELDDLRPCIEQPAARHGVLFEEGLVETILRELAGQPGALPLLQYTLDRLWQEAAPSESSRSLRKSSYDSLGGVRGALRQRAEALFEYRHADLDDPRPEEEREALRRVFLRLVELSGSSDGADGARAVSQRAPLPLFSESERLLIGELADEKLLLTGRSEAEVGTVELAHEVLLTAWPRLRDWLDHGRQVIYLGNRLAADARAWNKAQQGSAIQADAALWRGTRLAQVDELEQRGELARILGGLHEETRLFLNASLAERSRQASRELHRQQELADSLAHAREQQRLAEVARHHAEQRELEVYVERGRQLLVEQERPIDALLWLHRALDRGSRNPALSYLLADSMRPVDAVRAVLQGHGDAVNHASFSPDGRRVLTAGRDHVARVWDTQSGQPLAILKGHTNSIGHASFSPDGNRIVTASLDHTARLFDTQTGKSIFTLSGHSNGINQAVFSPDGSRIVIVSADKTLRIFDSMTGKGIAHLRGHSGPVNQISFSPDGRHFVTASDDQTARVWDSQTCRCLTVLKGHTDCVTAATFSPDNRYIVTVGRDPTAQLWDAQTARSLAQLVGHAGCISSVTFSPDGRQILTASGDKTARLWETATAKPLAVLKGHSLALRHAAFSSDRRRIVTCSDDTTARLWEAATGKPLAVLQGHTEPVRLAVFSADGMRILTASQDRTARVWDAMAGRPPSALKGHTGRVTCVDFNAEGRRIVTASEDGTGRVWNTLTRKLVVILKGHTAQVSSATFAPDGRHVLTTSADKSARLWDAKTGEQRWALKGHTAEVLAGSFSCDGLSAVTASADHTARVWDLLTGKLRCVLQGHGNWVLLALFCLDGRRILTVSRDRSACVWDADTGKLALTLSGHTQPVGHASLSSDGRRILTGSEDHTARLWDAQTGKPLAVLHGHGAAVTCTSFSPDATLAVTGSADHTARLWDVHTGKPLGVLAGHTAQVTSVCFSPDGLRVLTSSEDHTARTWSPSSGGLLSVLQGHTEGASQALFSPDGRRIVTASWDHTGRVWEVAPEGRTANELLELIRSRVPFKLEGSVIVPTDLAPAPASTGESDYEWP